MATNPVDQSSNVWRQYLMALDDVTGRLQRISRALEEASVPYALVGGRNTTWGLAESPLVIGDKVICTPGAETDRHGACRDLL